jgi:hypothetical protein
MLSYTGGNQGSAIPTMNLQGGGFGDLAVCRPIPDAPVTGIQAGTGIYITKIKTRNVRAAYESFQKDQLINGNLIGPDGKTFLYKRPFKNIFQVVESHSVPHGS